MSKRLSALSSLLTALALSGGCGEPTDGIDPNPESTVRAFSETGCATATPDQNLSNYTSGATVVGVTPTTYSNPHCFKSFVFDLGSVGTYDSISVQWTDPWPRTQAQCATTLGMQVYTPGGYTYGPFFAESKWENGACNLGGIGLWTRLSTFGPPGSRESFLSINNVAQAAPNFAGYNVRLSVTARTAANSTQSVKVSYKLSPPPPPPPCPGC